jgi:hypothetical protein
VFLSPCKPHNRPNRQRRIAQACELLPDHATMRRRIEEIYSLATDDEHSDGRQWYPAANAIARIVGDGLGIGTEHGAGIVAALSPQCSWDENVVRALAFADGDSIGGLADGLRKAERIGAGEHPTAVLGGRKVRSFYANIIGNYNAVTVDRHAVAIVFGRPLSDREIKVLERPGPYSTIAAAYRSVARKLGIAPAELQAITWLAWRRLKGWDYEVTDF